MSEQGQYVWILYGGILIVGAYSNLKAAQDHYDHIKRSGAGISIIKLRVFDAYDAEAPKRAIGGQG